MQADRLSLDWYVLDDRPRAAADPGTQRGFSRISPAFWENFRDRLFVFQKLSVSVQYQADFLIVTEHNVEYVAEAFHQVIVGTKANA